MENIVAFIPYIVGVIVLILLGLFVKACYKKAPPNTAMVITGPKGSRTVVGQGCFIIPVLQRVDTMSLENIQSDFTSRDEIPTRDAINIMVDAVANVAIAKDADGLKIAASKFLGYSINQIREIITPVFEGNIREIISQTTLKELIQGDKKEFAERVIENVTPNLRDMGLELTTFNIQNFKDRNGVIENLGLENTVQISKDAAISKARAEKEIAVAKAEAKKASNDAQVEAETAIAKRQNELAIQQAELKEQEDIKRAIADAAYKIQEEEQRKAIEAQTADANLVKLEKEIALKERAVRVTEQELEANVKKKADANKYAIEQQSNAELYKQQKSSEAELYMRAKNAEAAKIEVEKQAEAAKAQADADKFAKEKEAEARKAAMMAEAEGTKALGEAEAIAARAKGEAEAAAIRAKAEAEAEGMLKKAEALKQYGDAAQRQMELDALKVLYEQLPKIAEAIGQGYTGADIHVIGNDSGELAGNIMGVMTKIGEGLKGVGIDPTSLVSGMLGAKMMDNE